MKTHKDLYASICTFQNLLSAARKAQQGKRGETAVAGFNVNLEKELWQLEEELRTHAYQPGPYRTFQISEPKPRTISAAVETRHLRKIDAGGNRTDRSAGQGR